jgi:hypothetical protein
MTMDPYTKQILDAAMASADAAEELCTKIDRAHAEKAGAKQRNISSVDLVFKTHTTPPSVASPPAAPPTQQVAMTTMHPTVQAMWDRWATSICDKTFVERHSKILAKAVMGIIVKERGNLRAEFAKQLDALREEISSLRVDMKIENSVTRDVVNLKPKKRSSDAAA